MKGDDLKELVELHKLGPTVILDEFYSWYIYHEKEEDMGTSISAASYIDGESHLVPRTSSRTLICTRCQWGPSHFN